MNDKDIEKQGNQEADAPPVVDPVTAANLKSLQDELGIDGEDENEQITTAVDQQADLARKAAQEQQAIENGATLTAAGAVVVAERLIRMKYRFVTFSNEEKAAFIEELKPVVKKYRTEMPPWMQPWKEEARAIGVVGGMAFSVFMQVQEFKAIEQEKAEAAAAAKGGDGAATDKPHAAAAPAAAKPTGSALLSLAAQMDNA